MILTRVRLSVFLPGLGLLWGSFAMLMAATHNWSQLAGARFLLGVAEVCYVVMITTLSQVLTQVQAGFAPGCAYFVSSWYRRYELTTRYAIMYTSVPLAGAVSGLLAGVIIQYLDGIADLAGWRWLFVRRTSLLFHIDTNFESDSRGTCLHCGLSHYLLLHAGLSVQ